MTDLQILFLVLAVLYLWECACWLNRGSVAFRTWFGRDFQIAQPGRLLGNQRGGFVFAYGLPPLGMLFTARQSPISLSPEAVLAFVAPSVNPGSRPPQSQNFHLFDEINTVSADSRKLMINGHVFMRGASPGLTHQLARQLGQLKSLPPAKRGRAIQSMVQETLDTDQVEQRRDQFLALTRRLRFLANGLFVYLFVLAPFVAWKFGLLHTWISLVAGLLAFTTAIAVSFYRSHKQLFPAAEDERFTHFLILLLSPVTAVRAMDLLSRPLLETFHPLAVARVLCSKDAFRSFAALFLREAHYPALPLCTRPESAALQAENLSRSLLLTESETLLKKAGLNPAELLRPPAPSESACRSYCPRCLAQFTTNSGVCQDCGGVPLAAFSASDPKPR